MSSARHHSMQHGHWQRRARRATGAVLVLGLLAACDDSGQFNIAESFKSKPAAEAAPQAGATTKMVERDVEAPEVFSVTEPGLWDGRPSLGGVWVAHPDVTDPERVIIRNTVNGKFVIGALFRRERDIPGPRLQISSDAATSLGVLAGAPVTLNVTALRREQTPEAPAAEDLPEDSDDADVLEAPAEITATALDPIASAAAAIEASPPAPAAAPEAAEATAKPAPRPASAPGLSKPFIQIGIFSVEANAERTAKQMRGAGMVPTVKRQETNGKAFWRVLVGPATSESERTDLLTKIKGEGFSDAYAVTN